MKVIIILLEQILINASRNFESVVIREFPLFYAPVKIIKDKTNNISSRRILGNIFLSYPYNIEDILNDIEENHLRNSGIEKIVYLEDYSKYVLFSELFKFMKAPYSIGINSDEEKIILAIKEGVEKNVSDTNLVFKLTKSLFKIITNMIANNEFYFYNEKSNVLSVKDVFYTGILWDYYNNGKSLPYSPTGVKSFVYFLNRELYSEGKVNIESIFSNGELDNLNNELEEFYSYVFNLKTKKKVVEKFKKRYDGKERYSVISRIASFFTRDEYLDRENNVDFGFGEAFESCSDEDFFDRMLQYFSDSEKGNFVMQLVSSNGVGGEFDKFAVKKILEEVSPEIVLKGYSSFGVKRTVGKTHYWKLVRSNKVPLRELGQYNVSRLLELNSSTGLPWFYKISDFVFGINEYELKEKDVYGLTEKVEGVYVPDRVEFYIDSSSSMDRNMNDGVHKYYAAVQSFYSLLKALREASDFLDKNPLLRIHNFSSNILSSEEVYLKDYFEGKGNLLEMLFYFQSGTTKLNFSPLEEDNVAYFIITDGEVVSPYSEFESIKKSVSEYNSDVFLFEIEDRYELGRLFENEKSRKLQLKTIYSLNDLKEGMELLFYR